MAASEDALRDLLLDPDYWKPRLERLDTEPRHLVQVPRADMSRPGIDVLELRLRAHDRVPLRALMARPAFYKEGCSIQLRICEDLETCAIDWGAVERGTCDLVFPPPAQHRLQDRVLDVLRLARTAADLEEVATTAVQLYNGCQALPDEMFLARLVRDRGWA